MTSAKSPKDLSKTIAFFLGPLLFCLLLIFVPDDFVSADANKVLALAAWVIIWWAMEAVDMSVTALLPLVLFPFTGAMTMRGAAEPYAHPIIFLFMGGFMIALALEKHKVHERIALNLVRLTGTSGNGIILGFMLATAFISMWISNTATAMMMMPIALSVINLITSHKSEGHNLSRQERNFSLGLMLVIGYGATLGGLATIIGTPPNVVFVGLLDDFYDVKMDFGRWMLVGIPVAVMLLTLMYFIITKFLYPNNLLKIEGSDQLIRERLSALGELSKSEQRVIGVFALTSFCWIFQEYINLLSGKEVLNDTNIAMTGGLLMFVVPSGRSDERFLLSWKDTKNMAWGILILFGGGLCLARGLEDAGLIQVAGKWIAGQNTYSVWLLLSLIGASVILSEFMSNVALVQIFVPVVFGIATTLNVDPILLAMPVTFAASIGFMFPVATPPNAIVFATGHIKMKEMVLAGLILDLLSMLILLAVSLTLIPWVYGS